MVCCGVLRCGARIRVQHVHCDVLRCVLLCVAACCSASQCALPNLHPIRPLRCAAVCCGVLRCIAVCCSVLQFVAACSFKSATNTSTAMPTRRAESRDCGCHHSCCNVLQCVAVCCNVLQCVAVCCNVCCMPRKDHFVIIIPLRNDDHKMIISQHATHAATHCNTLQHIVMPTIRSFGRTQHILCNTLQHTATHCNTIQYTAKHCNAHYQIVS